MEGSGEREISMGIMHIYKGVFVNNKQLFSTLYFAHSYLNNTGMSAFLRYYERLWALAHTHNTRKIYDNNYVSITTILTIPTRQ